MRNLFILLFFFFQLNISQASNNIVYLDIQYIIDNSDLGIHLKGKVKKTKDKINLELTIKEKLIKEKENDIRNKKNILKKEELDKNIKELDNLVKKYQAFRNKSSKIVFEERKKYRLQILELLNPLLANFANNNNINLILEKKNVLVGSKVLDITENILTIVNEETKIKKLVDEN